ncbi:hypothetical protein Tco_1001181, partial [Tanacetum coccineum]
NSIQQLLAYSLITRTEVDIGEIIYSDLVTKLLNKSRLKYVSYPRFISCALQVLLGSDYTQDTKFGFLPPIPSNSNFTKEPSKVTDIELTVHMIAVNNQSDSMSPPPLAPKLKKGKSQTVTPTLPKSQGPEASGALSKKIKKPKSKKPPTKTKGQRLRGNIPPADMEPIHTSVADPSGTGAKYQTSSDVDPDTKPLKLQTYVDIQSFLLSNDELYKESDEEEVLAAGDDMDEDPQDDLEVRTPSLGPSQTDPSQVQESASDSSSHDLKKFDNTLPLIERQLIKYLRKMSRVLFNRITEKQSEQHKEVAVSYADLKASIDQYYDENIAHRDQTDKLMEASISSLDRSNTTISDLYKGLDVITQLLKDINNVVKDDPATNQKLNDSKGAALILA